MNSSNGNKTKSDIFHGTYSNVTSFIIGSKMLICLNDNLIGIFQFHCKSEPKQTSKKDKRDMCQCESIFTYLKSSRLFK